MENIYKNMEYDKKIEILMESYNTLRARGVVKTWTDLANLLGINRTCLSAAKQGDEKYLTDSLVSKIKGLMDMQNNAPESDNRTSENETSITLVPTIPYKAYKEIGIDLQEYIRSQSLDLHMSPAIAQFAKTDCHYFVGSDAMLPHLHQSDVLALKRMPEQAQVINGEIYVVNSRYNGLIARFVYDDGDHLILRASDEQRRYTPMRLPKKDIFGLYRVLGLVRTNI